MILRWPAPPLYLGILLRSALLTWLLAHLVVAAVLGGSGASGGALIPRGSLAWVGVVTVLAWIDLRRRTFWTLLPTLGLSSRTALGLIALVVLLCEVLLAALR